MSGPRVVEQRSVLDAPVEQVWARVSTLEGVNHELMPLMSMRPPRGANGFDLVHVEVGRPIGRFGVRLFGLLPVDHDDMTIVAIDPGRAFHERSSMLSATTWEHDRWLSPLPDGRTEIHDRVTFRPRVPGAGALQARVVALLFRHRHRRVVDWFS